MNMLQIVSNFLGHVHFSMVLIAALISTIVYFVIRYKKNISASFYFNTICDEKLLENMDIEKMSFTDISKEFVKIEEGWYNQDTLVTKDNKGNEERTSINYKDLVKWIIAHNTAKSLVCETNQTPNP